jgi:DNA-binding transcriptional ArsR family regulator
MARETGLPVVLARPSGDTLHRSVAVAPVAQWIERLPPEQKVVGSSPAGRATTTFTVSDQATARARPGKRPSRLRRALLHPRIRGCILNRMVQYASGPLDAAFAALSGATRRGVLEQLGRADASITDLADTFRMSLTGMKKHIGVLEQAGLVTTEKVGRVRTCRLGPSRLEEEAAWIDRYRQLWDERFDELDKVVEELKRKETVDGRKKRE